MLEKNAVVGCECKDCVKEKSSCCGRNAGSDFAYYSKRGIRLPPGMPIYECNDQCQCGPECSNRVVQKGRKHRVCIFRTANGRGWGVKAMQKIKKGSFIMEYVGEVGKLVSFIAFESVVLRLFVACILSSYVRMLFALSKFIRLERCYQNGGCYVVKILYYL